ncbi:hypothetical protein [Bradyrhizobium retamae]|nr:hypothetical protein [Bradyrhizobium retamae]
MTADKGAAVTGSASGEISDTFAFTIWLHKEAVIRALSAELDQCDYANALTQQQREVRLSEIGRDRLRAEREEAALVWHAQAQAMPSSTGPTSDTPASSTSLSSR